MIYIKSYRDIINKQFTVNKKRNLSTILGIILSIILFTTVGYIHAYYKEMNISYVKNNIGNYEAIFKNISKENLHILKDDVYTDKMGVYSEIYSTKLNSNNMDKNIHLYAVDNVILNQMFSSTINLESGRFPEKYGEIIVDNVGKNFLNKEIDDIITLNEKEYRIVGFYNENMSKGPSEIKLVTYLDEKNSFENLNVVFTVKPVKNKVKTIRGIAENLNINYEEEELESNIILNKLFFYYYGEANIENGYGVDNSRVIAIIAYGVILILTTFLIYGSINVSVKERIEQFSILRCIGATKIKIRRLLIKESLFLAVFSIAPGIVIGQIVSYFISDCILSKVIEMNSYVIPYRIYFHVIVISSILALTNIVVATLIPIIRVGEISPIEGLKASLSIQNNIKKRKSKIIRKIFGYNGELAYKNIRANNKNFIITTITSIIILSTFIVFTGYKNNLMKSYSSEVENSKDVTMDIRDNRMIEDEDIFKYVDEYKSQIEELGVSNEIYSKINHFIGGIFKNIKLNENINEKENENYVKEKNISLYGENAVYSNNINIVVVDDESLNEVISTENLDITPEEFKGNGALIVDRKVVKNLMDVTREPIFNFKKGEKFTLAIRKNKYSIEEKTIDEDIDNIKNDNKEINFKYLGSINGEKIIHSSYGSDNYITLIVSKDFYYSNRDIFSNSSEKAKGLIDKYVINLEIELKGYLDRNAAIHSLKEYSNKIEATVIDNKLSNIYVENNLMILSSLLYIVLVLIIIIGGVNIVNNKSMNIRIRGKEIGTLLALGINKKRLRKILLLEGIVQWFIASVSSIIISYTFLIVIYKILNYSSNIITGKMPILAMIFGCGILFVINILAVDLPIRKLRYIDTIELIRNKE